jgi:ribosome-associated toxin RatA of RatAB toxin-antitoxin module
MRTRQFYGEAADLTAASLEDSFALVAAVDRYPRWCPDNVRDVEVLDRHAGGQPSSVRMRMHISRGAISRDFDLFLAIVVDTPETVKLTRFTDHPTNQEFRATWRLSQAGGTRIALEIDARLRVPIYVPAHGIPDTIAEGFVTAACRELASPSR